MDEEIRRLERRAALGDPAAALRVGARGPLDWRVGEHRVELLPIPEGAVDCGQCSGAGWKDGEPCENCQAQGRIRVPAFAIMKAPLVDERSVPITGFTWHEAEALARESGLALPTLLEWQRAALECVRARGRMWRLRWKRPSMETPSNVDTRDWVHGTLRATRFWIGASWREPSPRGGDGSRRCETCNGVGRIARSYPWGTLFPTDELVVLGSHAEFGRKRPAPVLAADGSPARPDGVSPFGLVDAWGNVRIWSANMDRVLGASFRAGSYPQHGVSAAGSERPDDVGLRFVLRARPAVG